MMLTKHRRVAAHSPTPYSKALWHIRALSFDAHSHEQLLSRCPACNELLDFMPCAGVFCCSNCGHANFQRVPLKVVPFKDREAISFLTGLIDPENQGSRYGILSHPDLISEHAGDLFTVCVKAAEALTLKGGEEKKKGRADFDIPPIHLETAARALLNWPHGIVDLIDQIEDSAIARKSRKVVDSELIRRCDFLVSPSLQDKLRDLQHSFKIRIGSYTSVTAGSRVEAVADQFSIARNSGAFRKVARDTGISPFFLWSYFTSDLYSDPVSLGTSFVLRFATWQEELKFGELASKTETRSMPLKRLVKAAFKGEGDPWPSVIRAMLDKRLPFSKGKLGSGALNDLEVSEIEVWLNFLRSLKGSSHVNEKLRRMDTSLFLNIHIVGTANLFPGQIKFQELVNFDRMWVRDTELSDQLLISGDVVSYQSIAREMNSVKIETMFSNLKYAWRNRMEAEKYYNLR